MTAPDEVAEVRAEAPLVLPLGDVHLPYGPGAPRVVLRALAEDGQHSVARAPEHGHVLRVDPSLGPAAADEGPLAPLAAALRDHPPPHAVELLLERARERPGVAVAVRRAALTALAALTGRPAPPPASPADAACTWGRPVDAHGAPLDVDPQRLAWLDDALLLFRDPVAIPHPGPWRGPAERSPATLLAAEAPDALLTRLRGEGLEAAWGRDRDLVEALRAQGLVARWSLGDGLWLGLVVGGQAAEAAALAADHDLDVIPCLTGGVHGARVLDPLLGPRAQS